MLFTLLYGVEGDVYVRSIEYTVKYLSMLSVFKVAQNRASLWTESDIVLGFY